MRRLFAAWRCFQDNVLICIATSFFRIGRSWKSRALQGYISIIGEKERVSRWDRVGESLAIVLLFKSMLHFTKLYFSEWMKEQMYTICVCQLCGYLQKYPVKWGDLLILLQVYNRITTYFAFNIPGKWSPFIGFLSLFFSWKRGNFAISLPYHS